MVDDEPALWASIPDRIKPNVDVAAKAMCQHRDPDDLSDICNCHPSRGGQCLAFGLYGDLAFVAAKAIDDFQIDRLIKGLGLSA